MPPQCYSGEISQDPAGLFVYIRCICPWRPLLPSDPDDKQSLSLRWGRDVSERRPRKSLSRTADGRKRDRRGTNEGSGMALKGGGGGIKNLSADDAQVSGGGFANFPLGLALFTLGGFSSPVGGCLVQLIWLSAPSSSSSCARLDKRRDALSSSSPSFFLAVDRMMLRFLPLLSVQYIWLGGFKKGFPSKLSPFFSQPFPTFFSADPF